jgi:hypothetical protein
MLLRSVTLVGLPADTQLSQVGSVWCVAAAVAAAVVVVALVVGVLSLFGVRMCATALRYAYRMCCSACCGLEQSMLARWRACPGSRTQNPPQLWRLRATRSGFVPLGLRRVRLSQWRSRRVGPLGVVPHSRAAGHSVPARSKLYSILRPLMWATRLDLRGALAC